MLLGVRGCRDQGGWEVGSQTVGGGDNTAGVNVTSRPTVAIQVSAPMCPPVVSS